MERRNGSRSGYGGARSGAVPASDPGSAYRSNSRSRDAHVGSSLGASFNGSRSAANVNTSRIKVTPTESYTSPSPPSRRKNDASYTKSNAMTLHDAMLSPREREILMQLLVQITDFVARKQHLSSRHASASLAASVHSVPDWRKDFSRSAYGDRAARESRKAGLDMFEVVIQVCEDRMQRLHDGQQEISSRCVHQSPRVLVAEAMVQELLVSLMEIQMEKKEEMILDEVDTAEIMRQLHMQLEQDEQMASVGVRHRVTAAAGDGQQLQELQLMLRTDFLQEVAHTQATQRLNESSQNNDASLQFAWETIQEQKKEIVRLRAENQELKARKPIVESSSWLSSSIFNEEPVKTTNLLRSQLSSHHDTNLNILHDYITRLEDALRKANSSERGRDGRDASNVTFDSSRGEEKENWLPAFSTSTIRDDFSRTQPVGRRSCEQCKLSSALVVALQSEVKQLRAQATTDEESLVLAEKGQLHLKRENSALTSTLLSAKQQQQDLRQLILDITHEKHQLQGLTESEQRTSDRNVRLLKDELEGLKDLSKQQARKLERLELELTNECNEKRFIGKKHSALEGDYEKTIEENTALRAKISKLQHESDSAAAQARQSAQMISELQANIERLQSGSNQNGIDTARGRDIPIQEKDDKIRQLEKALESLETKRNELKQRRAKLKSQIASLQQIIQERDQVILDQKTTIEELKQDKQLFASLQKVEREKSLLQQDELDQAQEKVSLQTERLSTALSECQQLRDQIETLERRLEDVCSSLRDRDDEYHRLQQDLQDAEMRKQSLEDHVNAQLELQKEVDKFQTVHVEQSEELQNKVTELTQEVTASKTTILMWMNKYNAMSDKVKRLEEEALFCSEERYSLQRQIEGMEVQHQDKLLEVEAANEARITAQISSLREKANEELRIARQDLTSKFESKIAALEKLNQDRELQEYSLKAELARNTTNANKDAEELAMLRETSLTLENEVGILKDANRGLQHELRAEERQRKTLGMLVQTLQERPTLQRRAFQEMLSSSERQFEFIFTQLLSKVEGTTQKLSEVEFRCKNLRTQLCHQKREPTDSSASALVENQLDLHVYAVSNATNTEDCSRSGDNNTCEEIIVARYETLCRMVNELAASCQVEYSQQLSNSDNDTDFHERTQALFMHLSQVLKSQEQCQAPHEASGVPVASELQQSSATREEDFVGSGSIALQTADSAPVNSNNVSWIEASSTLQSLDSKMARANIYRKWHYLIAGKLMHERMYQQSLDRKRLTSKWIYEANKTLATEKKLRLWKWKYLILAISEKSRGQQLESETQALSSVWEKKFAQIRLQSKWHMLKFRLERQQLVKSSMLVVLRALQQEKRYQKLQKLACFSSWRYETKIQGLEKQLTSLEEKTATLSPVSTVALGNCVRLLQRFCEGTDTPPEVGKSRETLVKYLIESNNKVASWKRTIDRKVEEFSDRKEQLCRLQERCAEMKELVALSQRLIGELERKAASQQAIVDAACNFARAYKTLRSSVSAQMFKTDEFYSACKRVVEVVHATDIRSVRSGSEASTIHATDISQAADGRSVQLPPLDEMAELSASRAAVTFAMTGDAGATEPNDARRRNLNDSNIAMLERAVGSLKNANEIRVMLETALAEKTKALAKVTAQLERKSVQFAVLRAFLHWKCSTYALRFQEAAEANN
ncbi:hypothetical protein FI667_g1043, partial [Globisporangium splendens]